MFDMCCVSKNVEHRESDHHVVRLIADCDILLHDPSGPPTHPVAEVRKVIAVQFGILSPKRIRDMSVAEIKLPALKVVRVAHSFCERMSECVTNLLCSM